MHTPLAYSHLVEGISRRKLSQIGLAAGLTVSAFPLSRPAPLWGAEAAQQHYVYANSAMMTGSWQPYVKNYAPNQTFDYGSRAAALWLDR